MPKSSIPPPGAHKKQNTETQCSISFMLAGINTTLVCVQALKAKKLFDVCNATESVIDGVNELYFGLLQHLQRMYEIDVDVEFPHDLMQ